MLAGSQGAGASWIGRFLYLSLGRIGLRFDSLELAQDNLP